ncbi:MAG: ATP-dependent zinc metalloprotease FtsH [Gemmatimonadota bacterium]|nr:MAG: ATP-dependent zinc metalloprotease FtsH [Gemmatimonadota bacterium]
MNDRRDPDDQRPEDPRDPGRKKDAPRYGRATKTMAFWAVLILLFLVVFQTVYNDQAREVQIVYTEFLEQVDAGNIRDVRIVEQELHGELAAPAMTEYQGVNQAYTRFSVIIPPNEEGLTQRILDKNGAARISADIPGTRWTQILLAWLPILLILGIWIFIMRQMQSGGNRAFTFGKSKARLMTGGDRPKITFEDVAGATEAKQELEEIIEFLRDPAKFQKLGGKIPKGALLLGAPGTGKTLLAKAVAGEAAVPFFSMSGSDFVEMFVGVGASRVRDLFEQGRKNAPCIIFIDEIDAVGRHRGAGLGGGHDEREQTLNQLLVEMDGFDSSEGVILVAATNRPDVLDPALLRPGRFDRQIVVDLPDVRGRLGILKVHSKPIPLNDDVNLEKIARGTPGFSGADLANVMNEAALLAARRNRDSVTMIDLFDAKDKVAMGPERKSLILSEQEKEVIAYHEAGHALVALHVPGANPVEKVTIVPRGQSLGTTWFLPAERRNPTKSAYEADIAVSMGGRAAEEIVLGEITSGAKADIDGATNIARRMVCEWGMSERLGPIALGQGDEQVFLGREIMDRRHVSDETSEVIDEEIRRLVEAGRATAQQVLTEHRDVLDSLAMALLERETLDAEDVQLLVQGSPLPDVKDVSPAVEPSDDSGKNTAASGESSSSLGDTPAP